MPALTDAQTRGLTRLLSVATDPVVRRLEVALAEDAENGGSLAAVHRLVAREAAERRLRALAFAPVVGLCRPSPWKTAAFPASTVERLWTALKDSAPAKIAAAEAASEAPAGAADQPLDPVFDELCLMAAQGLRNEASAFQAAAAALNAA